MQNRDDERKFLIVPYFDKEPLFFPCISCSEVIEIYSRDQQRFAHGGVGYLCKNCGNYCCVVMCPHCREMHALSSSQWDEVRKSEFFECIDCGGKCGLAIHRFQMKVTDQIVSLLPNNWSETVGEQQYLDAIVEDSGEAISLHAATCGRVRSFLKYVDEAREFGFRGWGFYNNEDLIDSLQKNLIDPEPFVFNSCNSLVSVLELMTHEVYVSLRIAVGEKEKIYFNREHKKLAKISRELSIKIKELSESMEI